MIGRRPRARPLDRGAPRLVVFLRRRPRDVVHRSGSLRCRGARARRRRRSRCACRRARRSRLEAERALEQARLRSGSERVGATPAKPRSACSSGISGCFAISGSSPLSSITSSSASPRDRRRRASRRSALAADALLPEVERLVRRDAERDAVHHAGTRASARRVGILEERDVGAGGAALVGVEEVVDGRIVLVDRLLDEAETERPARRSRRCRARRP